MEYKMQATLNLSKGFGQCGDSLAFEYRKFPAGEVYFNCAVPWDITTVRINIRANTSDQIMLLLLAVDSLRRQGVDQIEVFMPYLPYSRQDRVCKKGDSFSLSTLCALLRALRVGLVTYDVHSNVAEVLLDGSALRQYTNHREVFDFVDYLELGGKHTLLVAPDADTRKKIQALIDADKMGRFDDILFANKTRVSEHVITVDALDDHNLNDCVCIVVDDICDGGGTFNALGVRLQQAGCEEAYLFVSHGVFSKGTEDLLRFYKKIGTTNSIREDHVVGFCGVKKFNLDY